MIPANDPDIDYRAVVRRGYDECAEAYEKSRKSEVGIELNALTERLKEGSEVLEIGSGAGVPVARALADRYRVTGVDVSAEMVRRARKNVLNGKFLLGDVMSVDLSPGSFDAVVAFYSIFHIPREEHLDLFRKVYEWLRPPGYLLCTLSHHNDAAYIEKDFFGATMYWSNYGLNESLEMLADAGFTVVERTSTGGGWNDPVESASEDHPLVLAQKQ